MDFQIVDTRAAFRRLLAAPDDATRAAIFQSELIEPFAGLVKFFGGDGPASFAQWGMKPEQYGDNGRARMTAIVTALEQAEAWTRAVQALEQGRAAFTAYADRIPLGTIVFGLLLADMSATPQAHGYTGFGGIPGWIMTVYDLPDEYNLARIEAATVHELHHNILGVVQPRNMLTVTVGEYMIMEGLAESFSAELYGADKVGPWVTEFDDALLAQTKETFRPGLNVSGFNEVRRYIFGDPGAGLPLYAGYAIGYRVVQAYLARTGQRVPETTFVPAHEIITASGFFE
ncbi:hypothetical protein TFLX_05424 [Thermoflexales bacterium]|nr:hypothetical protein TFLX_05424 [Thermoflexales bacterium]